MAYKPHTEFPEDGTPADADKGTVALAIRKDDLSCASSDGKYTALPVSVHSSVKGVDVHVVGDGDKYIKSNIAEGAAVGTDDGIPVALEDGTGNKLNVQGTTRGTKNALSVEIVDAAGAQITSFGAAGGALETGGNLAAAATSLGTLDNIVAGSEAQVDVVTSALPTGAATEATLGLANAKLPSALNNDRFVGTLAADNAGTPVDLPIFNATQSGIPVFLAGYASGANALQDQGNIAHDTADAGNPMKIGGKAITLGAAPAAVSATNDRVNAWYDMVGRQSVFQAWTPTNITSATTTQVKASSGILHSIIINTPGTANTITVYNHASSDTTPIAVITPIAASSPLVLDFDSLMSAGIRVKTAATCDLTVLWA